MSDMPSTGNRDVDAVLAQVADLTGTAGERLAMLSKAQDDLARILDDSRSGQPGPKISPGRDASDAT